MTPNSFFVPSWQRRFGTQALRYVSPSVLPLKFSIYILACFPHTSCSTPYIEHTYIMYVMHPESQFGHQHHIRAYITRYTTVSARYTTRGDLGTCVARFAYLFSPVTLDPFIEPNEILTVGRVNRQTSRRQTAGNSLSRRRQENSRWDYREDVSVVQLRW